MAGRFVSVGECMIEMSGGADSRYTMGFAGDTLNTAWYARALLPGDWSVDYVTALGDDHYSAGMVDFFQTHGLGTGHIRRIPGKRPGLYLIHQADGDRQFTYWREASAARLLADDTAALKAAFAGAGLVYFSGITLAILAGPARAKLISAIAAARGAGSQIAFDPNIRPALWPDAGTVRAALTEAAGVCDFVLPTHSDEAVYFGDADVAATARRYLNAGAAEVAVKNGAEAALVATGDDFRTVPVRTTERVVDATGAGDSFNGAYLAARLGGLGPADAAVRAHGVAAEVIGHPGALIAPVLMPTA